MENLRKLKIENYRKVLKSTENGMSPRNKWLITKIFEDISEY